MVLKFFPWHSFKTRVTLLTLSLFVVSVWSVYIYTSSKLRQDLQRQIGEQQLSTVTAIAREVDSRLTDRMQALETVAKDVTPALLDNPPALQVYLEQRPLLQLLFNGGAVITRTEGIAIADVPRAAGRMGINYAKRESVSISLKEGKVAVGRPIPGKKSGLPLFSITAPIFDAESRVIGVIIGVIDLSKPNFLDHITETRYGGNGGYMFISPKHQLVVTATDKLRVMQPVPRPGINKMHDNYMMGYEGFGVALNTRGVLELSAAKQIPAAGWFVAAVLPAPEAFEPIDRLLQSLFVSALITTALAGAVTWAVLSLLLRRQFAPMVAVSKAIAVRSSGDQLVQALPVVRQDEIGELITSFNTLLENCAQREAALKASESFKDIILNSLDAEIAVIDHNGVIQAVNARWYQHSLDNSCTPGVPAPHTGVGSNYFSFCGDAPANLEDDSPKVGSGIQSVLNGLTPSFHCEYPCNSPTENRWFAMTVMPLRTNSQLSAVISHTEITGRKLVETALIDSEERWKFAIEGAGDGLWDWNTQTGKAFYSTRFKSMLGYAEDDVFESMNNWHLHVHPEDVPAVMAAIQPYMEGKIGAAMFECRMRCKDGTYKWTLGRSMVVERDADGKPNRMIGTNSDISERKRNERQLEHMAQFDPLTDLPNRVLLADRMQQAMAQTQRRGQQLAVAFLDLDGFKAINDKFGHQVGDQVLTALAHRMSAVLRQGDTLARLGGDEFVVVMIDLESASACLPLLDRLLCTVAQPLEMSGLMLHVSASLGVTYYPQAQDIDADQLLRQADQAMYQAKVAGKNRYHVFDAAQDINLRDHHQRLQRIRTALESQEFRLYYQPKVNMRMGLCVGAEALIRWQHPEKGLLAPGAFLPEIEDHPLAVEVGEWVIDSALTQMEVWQAEGLNIHVSVNIGASQLQRGDFVERLKVILSKHSNIDPHRLQLEVLETSALQDMALVSRVIEDCSQIGVTFALDDFGTGYSSLTYLKGLHVSQVKIDQSFVRDMLEDPDDLAILRGVISLAEAFKREVIAEGVETVAHGTALLQLGCELAQGYGIARPMPPDQIPGWLENWRPDAEWSELPWLGGHLSSILDE